MGAELLDTLGAVAIAAAFYVLMIRSAVRD